MIRLDLDVFVARLLLYYYNYVLDLLWRGVGVYATGLPDPYLRLKYHKLHSSFFPLCSLFQPVIAECWICVYK